MIYEHEVSMLVCNWTQQAVPMNDDVMEVFLCRYAVLHNYVCLCFWLLQKQLFWS